MNVPSRHALVLSHITFEDLGSLEQPLRERNFAIENVNLSTDSFPISKTQSCDLLIVLGGPMGVYEQKQYPFLADEIASIRQRLADRKHTLGICLGAQLMAAALGANVYPGKNGAEIGWFPLQPAPDSATPGWFAPLLAPRQQIFHWHGDTFDVPPGTQLLATSELYQNQAFALGYFALALQFHPEVTAEGLESWYAGHANELQQKGISVADLRAAAQKHGLVLEKTASRFWNLWLDYIL